jgi:NAD(P)-dependent dehydrogenase (short-subunit alcohol dehydrogenase family)
MIPIRDQVVFLTGAAEGLGREIAVRLASYGVRLALFDVQQDKLTALCDQLSAQGSDVAPIAVDLADATATNAAFGTAIDRFGTPRALIHNAAVLKEVSMADVSFANWRREFEIIVQGAFLAAKAVWDPMIAQGGGSIVFVSSGSALSGFVKETAYTPGKHGQEGLMRTLAIEGKQHNIAVNTMTTGAPIDTPMSASHYTEEMKIGMVHPSALADAFAFLAGIDASFATGQRFDAYKVSEAMKMARATSSVQPTAR